VTTPLAKLTVPVATLIAAAQRAYDADRAAVAASKEAHESGEIAARAKIVTQLRKEADRVERGGKIDANGTRYNRYTGTYSDYEYQHVVKAAYPGKKTPSVKIKSDLALLKATDATTIVVTTDSQWASYL
jgi:hypothetical protein